MRTKPLVHYFSILLIALFLALVLSTWFAVSSFDNIFGEARISSSEELQIEASMLAKPEHSIQCPESLPCTRFVFYLLVIQAVVFSFALLAVFTFYRRLHRPLAELERVAERYTLGDFSSHPPSFRISELDKLSSAFTRMGTALNETFANLQEEKSKLATVFAGMTDGILVLNKLQQITNLNTAAAELLELSPKEAVGKKVKDVVKEPSLRLFCTEAMHKKEESSLDLILSSFGEREILVKACPLDISEGDSEILLVLRDVTDFRRFEQVRRDFVANVSHELKTPVTSIKGFVETLLDGALDSKADARRFLEIVKSQAERLTSIIEDLLMLAHLESSNGIAQLEPKSEQLDKIASTALQTCRSQATAKDIELELLAPQPCHAKVDRGLLEEAILNLVDNAIKYSPPGTTVTVRISREGEFCCIEVIDQGQGIPEEHLPRIFERFYRVDRARSRKLGGTGLGLAIVKHIANIHRGTVKVESTLGKGSKFEICLPAETDPIDVEQKPQRRTPN